VIFSAFALCASADRVAPTPAPASVIAAYAANAIFFMAPSGRLPAAAEALAGPP